MRVVRKESTVCGWGVEGSFIVAAALGNKVASRAASRSRWNPSKRVRVGLGGWSIGLELVSWKKLSQFSRPRGVRVWKVGMRLDGSSERRSRSSADEPTYGGVR